MNYRNLKYFYMKAHKTRVQTIMPHTSSNLIVKYLFFNKLGSNIAIYLHSDRKINLPFSTPRYYLVYSVLYWTPLSFLQEITPEDVTLELMVITPLD